MTLDAAAVFACYNAIPDAVFVLRDRRIVWSNDAATALTGYSPALLIGRQFSTLLTSEQHNGTHDAHDVELLTAENARVWVDLGSHPLNLSGDAVEVITLHDIRERKRAEELLQKRETTYRRSIESSFDGFFLLRALCDQAGILTDFLFLDVNAHGETLTRRNRADLLGQPLSKVFSPHFATFFHDKYSHVRETGEVLEEDFEIVLRDGSKHWYQHQIVPVDVGIAVFTRDITERKRTELALRESEYRYRALFNQSNDGVGLIDLEGKYILVNEQMATMLGYTPEEMRGIVVFDLIVPGEVEAGRQIYHALSAGETIPLFERTFRRRDGSEFFGEVNVTMVRDADGKPLYMQSILRDQTRRKATEDALRESEERYRIISELISDYAYAFRIEPNGTPVHEWITDSFERMTGYTHEEIDAKGQFALYHPDEHQRVEADMMLSLQGWTFGSDYRIITKSGALRWLHLLRKPVWDDAQGRVVRFFGVAQDITERKQAEEELRSSEEQYRLLAENASDMIARSTFDGVCTYVSSACQALLGVTADELVGQNWLSLIHPDDYDSARDVYDGVLHTNEALTFACRMRRRDEYVWFEVTAKAIRDPESGAVRELITVSRDIIHRKQMDAILLEQERLLFELQTEQELGAMKSNLMRTISHEFRTPLSMILTSVDFLDSYIDRLPPEQRSERLQAIRVQIKRLSEMLDDISFVVQGTLNHVTARVARLNLEAFCRSIVDDIQTTIGKGHRLVFMSDGKLQEAIADKALILRILGNLLSNAVKYSPENSAITLHLSRDGDDALLCVSDEGIGISPEEQKRIFEPFYRSDRVIDTVGGTGLGLSIVKDCVDLHGGTISVSSQLGKGTTFTIRLPQSDLAK